MNVRQTIIRKLQYAAMYRDGGRRMQSRHLRRQCFDIAMTHLIAARSLRRMIERLP